MGKWGNMSINHRTRRGRHIAAASITATAVVAALLGSAPAVAAEPAGIYTVSFTSTAAANAAIDQLGIEPDAEYKGAIKGFTADLTSAQVEGLRATTTVRGMSVNAVVTGAAQEVTPALKSVEADKAPTSATTAGAWDGPPWRFSTRVSASTPT